jgi:hypothetical protein
MTYKMASLNLEVTILACSRHDKAKRLTGCLSNFALLSDVIGSADVRAAIGFVQRPARNTAASARQPPAAVLDRSVIRCIALT